MIPVDAATIATALGLVLTTASVGLAVVERSRRIRLDQIRKTEIAGAINRTRMMIPTNTECHDLLRATSDPHLIAFVWKRHRGLSDLYLDLVRQYVSRESKFTYQDVERLIDASVIETSWEERQWREIIALRDENRRVAVPSLRLKETHTRRNDDGTLTRVHGTSDAPEHERPTDE